MKVREESEKAALKFNTKKTKTGIQLHHFLANIWEKVEALTDFIFSGSKITTDCDYSHEIQRCLLLGKRAMTNLDSILKSKDIALLIKVHIVLLLPPVPPSIRVFSNESTLRMRWPEYWSFSFSIIPSKEIPGLISLQSKGLSRVFSNTTVQKHQFFGTQPSSQSNSHIHT